MESLCESCKRAVIRKIGEVTQVEWETSEGREKKKTDCV